MLAIATPSRVLVAYRPGLQPVRCGRYSNLVHPQRCNTAKECGCPPGTISLRIRRCDVSSRPVRALAEPRSRNHCRTCHKRILPGIGGTSPPGNGSNWSGGWGGGGAFGASRALSAVASSAPQLGSEEVILLDVSGMSVT